MGYFGAEQVPVYDHLAAHFCICDAWHSSVPGATWPNRLYAVAGSADGSRDDRPHPQPPIAVTRESLLVGGGKRRGKSGDILLTATPPEGDQRLPLLIEVKGSWEAKVQSRMNTQLESEYMKETGITHAIYLVFWFDRSEWDPDDYRHARSTFETAGAAQDFFEDQARKLSERDRQIRAVVLDGSLI